MSLQPSSLTQDHSFTELEIQQIRKTLDALNETDRIEASLTFENVDDFAGAMILVKRASHLDHSPIVLLESRRQKEGPKKFSAFPFGEHESLGPKDYYNSIDEALKHAVAFIKVVVTNDRKKLPIRAVKSKPAKEDIQWYWRVASLIGIVVMYLLFGLICSLIGFAAYFLTKSKLGTAKAIGVTLVVAATARVSLPLLFK